MKKVYITRAIDQEATDLLKDHFEVTVNPHDRELTREELLEVVPHYQGIITMLSNRIDEEILDRAKEVEIFANYAVGYNNFDVAGAKKRGILMSNTPGVLTDATADLAFALLLASARRLTESDRYVARGDFKEWHPKLLLGKELKGRTLGIIGFGEIGQAVAKRGRGFGMKVVYYNRTPRKAAAEALGAEYLDFEELLKRSDFISLHTPLSEATRHLIDARAISLMKDDVVFVNTSRGPIVDEQALIEALSAGKFFGVGLDVYEHEPVVPGALIDCERVINVPHIGSATVTARRAMAMLAAGNVIAALRGEAPPNEL